MKARLQLFEKDPIRAAWDDEKEEWFFSVVDVVGVLTESKDPQRYWSVLKLRIKREIGQPTTICSRLKLKSADGKFRLTDVATITQLLRLIQSIPSPKAEPFKQWLAEVGANRIEEEIDPQKTIDRARETYLRKGYPEEWIDARIKGILTRKELTNEWKARGVRDREYAVLTDIIHKGTFDVTVKEHKNLKGLTKENLRDNMTSVEAALTTLSEVTATEITRSRDPRTTNEHRVIAKESGDIAGNARREIEAKTGRPVLSSKNAKVLIAEEKERKQQLESERQKQLGFDE